MHIFGTNIDLNNNEAKQFRAENLLSFPSVGPSDAGRILFHGGQSKFYGWDANNWIHLGDVGGGGYVLPTSTVSILGGVKIDGTTITINGSGVISAVTSTEPSGLEALNEGNGIGWRLIGRLAANSGDIGLNAVDFGFNYVAGTKGATGAFSFNHGEDNTLSGYGAVGFGALINSSGIDDFNAGINLTNAGYSNSLFGTGHDVTSMNVTVVGQAANVVTQQIVDYNATTTKELFVVGNGTIANANPTFPVLTRSNAFLVRMNGEVTGESTTVSVINSESTGKQFLTREWFETKVPKKIVMNVTQTGTNTPTFNDVFNDSGDVITWARTGIGNYNFELDGDHTGTTAYILGSGQGTTNHLIRNFMTYDGKTDKTKFFVQTYNSFLTPSDGMLTNSTIKLEIYP